MSRLPRFEDYRFIGLRDTMVVYDCDDEEEFAVVSRRVDEESLTSAKLIQSFAPDTVLEARNRGFRPSSRSVS